MFFHAVPSPAGNRPASLVPPIANSFMLRHATILGGSAKGTLLKTAILHAGAGPTNDKGEGVSDLNPPLEREGRAQALTLCQFP